MSYKLTIDINLMQEEAKTSSMGVLKRWKSEGKIELIEAVRPRSERDVGYGWPGSPPKPPPSKRVRKSPWKTQDKVKDGGVNFRSISSILYPTKDSQKLDLGEMNNVTHLMKHHERKNEFFITQNLKDFIESGKQDRLRSTYGIVIMTPDEVVGALTHLEGWK